MMAVSPLAGCDRPGRVFPAPRRFSCAPFLKLVFSPPQLLLCLFTSFVPVIRSTVSNNNVVSANGTSSPVSSFAGNDTKGGPAGNPTLSKAQGDLPSTTNIRRKKVRVRVPTLHMGVGTVHDQVFLDAAQNDFQHLFEELVVAVHWNDIMKTVDKTKRKSTTILGRGSNSSTGQLYEYSSLLNSTTDSSSGFSNSKSSSALIESNSTKKKEQKKTQQCVDTEAHGIFSCDSSAFMQERVPSSIEIIPRVPSSSADLEDNILKQKKAVVVVEKEGSLIGKKKKTGSLSSDEAEEVVTIVKDFDTDQKAPKIVIVRDPLERVETLYENLLEKDRWFRDSAKISFSDFVISGAWKSGAGVNPEVLGWSTENTIIVPYSRKRPFSFLPELVNVVYKSAPFEVTQGRRLPKLAVHPGSRFFDSVENLDAKVLVSPQRTPLEGAKNDNDSSPGRPDGATPSGRSESDEQMRKKLEWSSAALDFLFESFKHDLVLLKAARERPQIFKSVINPISTLKGNFNAKPGIERSAVINTKHHQLGDLDKVDVTSFDLGTLETMYRTRGRDVNASFDVETENCLSQCRREIRIPNNSELDNKEREKTMRVMAQCSNRCISTHDKPQLAGVLDNLAVFADAIKVTTGDRYLGHKIKTYLYDLPEYFHIKEFRYANRGCLLKTCAPARIPKLWGGYGDHKAELVILGKFLNSLRFVSDPADADLFLVPALTATAGDNSRCRNRGLCRPNWYEELFIQELKYLECASEWPSCKDRKSHKPCCEIGGKKKEKKRWHLFLGTQDSNQNEPRVRVLPESVNLVVNLGPGGVVVPYLNNVRYLAPGQSYRPKALYERTIFAYAHFRVRPWTLDRENWLRQLAFYQKYSSMMTKSSTTTLRRKVVADSGMNDTHWHSDARHTLGDAVFTLCPGGDLPSTKRFFDAILHGSLPVVLERPFSKKEHSFRSFFPQGEMKNVSKIRQYVLESIKNSTEFYFAARQQNRLKMNQSQNSSLLLSEEEQQQRVRKNVHSNKSNQKNDNFSVDSSAVSQESNEFLRVSSSKGEERLLLEGEEEKPPLSEVTWWARTPFWTHHLRDYSVQNSYPDISFTGFSYRDFVVSLTPEEALFEESEKTPQKKKLNEELEKLYYQDFSKKNRVTPEEAVARLTRLEAEQPGEIPEAGGVNKKSPLVAALEKIWKKDGGNFLKKKFTVLEKVRKYFLYDYHGGQEDAFSVLLRNVIEKMRAN